jgi:hypothetical protein
MQPPRIRLTIEGPDVVEPGRVRLAVDELQGEQDTPRRIGFLLVPPELVPQLGGLGVLVTLGAFQSLTITGPDAPTVATLDERTARLVRLAGKILR